MAAFYTLLYIAVPEEAEAIACDEDAADNWPSIWLRHIGDLELVALWNAVANVPPEEATLMADLLFEASEEGPFVMRVPPEFVSAIAAVAPEQIAELATAWGRAEELAHWRPEDLAGVVSELQEFAQRALASNKSVLQVAHL